MPHFYLLVTLEEYILGALWELISESFQNCEASAYSLHAVYFLAMCRSQDSSVAPKEDALQALDQLLATIPKPQGSLGSSHGAKSLCKQGLSAHRQQQQGWYSLPDSELWQWQWQWQCWHGPGSWLPPKGDTFPCVPAHLVLMVMLKPRIVSSLPVCQLWKKKGLF